LKLRTGRCWPKKAFQSAVFWPDNILPQTELAVQHGRDLPKIPDTSKVLENGPDVYNSESDSDHSDHGEEWADGEMYTTEMLGPDGKKIKGRQQISPQQV
jgi:hypothetical protein